jgi:hypothetical protein
MKLLYPEFTNNGDQWTALLGQDRWARWAQEVEAHLAMETGHGLGNVFLP